MVPYSRSATPHLVHFMQKSYLKGIQSLASVKARFQNVQSTIPESVALDLEADYEAKGGEQFLENQEELKCKARLTWLNRRFPNRKTFIFPQGLRERSWQNKWRTLV